MPERPKKVCVKPSVDGQWFVEVVGGNGEIVLVGETLVHRTSAIEVAEEYAPAAAMIEVFDAAGKLERDYPAPRKAPDNA